MENFIFFIMLLVFIGVGMLITVLPIVVVVLLIMHHSKKKNVQTQTGAKIHEESNKTIQDNSKSKKTLEENVYSKFSGWGYSDEASGYYSRKIQLMANMFGLGGNQKKND